jgi:hypothetical protein
VQLVLQDQTSLLYKHLRSSIILERMNYSTTWFTLVNTHISIYWKMHNNRNKQTPHLSEYCIYRLPIITVYFIYRILFCVFLHSSLQLQLVMSMLMSLSAILEVFSIYCLFVHVSWILHLFIGWHRVIYKLEKALETNSYFIMILVSEVSVGLF